MDARAREVSDEPIQFTAAYRIHPVVEPDSMYLLSHEGPNQLRWSDVRWVLLYLLLMGLPTGILWGGITFIAMLALSWAK